MMTGNKSASSGEKAKGVSDRSRYLSLAALGTCFVVLRIAAVTHFDLVQAMRLLPAINLGQYLNVVLGWAMPHPIVAGTAAAAFGVLTLTHVPLRADALGRHLPDLLVAVLFILLSVRIGEPAAWLAGIIAAGFVVVLKLRLRSNSIDEDTTAQGMLMVYGVVLIIAWLGIAAAAAFDDTPWVPMTNVSDTQYSGPGYVMGSYGGRLVVLTEARDVVYLPNAAFKGQ